MSIVSWTRRPWLAGMLPNRIDFPPQAVDADDLRAVHAHQQFVVNLLDAGLPDDGAVVQAICHDLPFARLADVSEQMRGK